MLTPRHAHHLFACLALAATAAFTAHAAADVVVVSPTNMNGWSFANLDENGLPPGYMGAVTQMVTGPATPPLGTGSAELATAANHGDASAQINTGNLDGLALSALTSLSYSTYDVTNNGQQFPYLKLSLSNGDDLFFEPPYQTPATGNPNLPDQGATVMNQWQNWDALDGGWWNNNGDFNPGTTEGNQDGVDSIANYLDLYPGVTITGTSLRVGYASPSDNFQSNVDNFTFGTADGSTTYNFEPAAVPEPASASLLALSGVALLFRRRRLA